MNGCDHKFVDSNHCLNCGWVPPVPTRLALERAQRKADLMVLLVVVIWLVVILFGSKCFGGSIVTEGFLDALIRVESNGDARAVGDMGCAHGAFQFQRAAWSDVNRERSRARLPRVPFIPGAYDVETARVFARSYLQQLESSLASARGVHPSTELLYATWNLGLKGIRRRGFLLSNCPAKTRRAAQAVSALEAGSRFMMGLTRVQPDAHRLSATTTAGTLSTNNQSTANNEH